MYPSETRIRMYVYWHYALAPAHYMDCRRGHKLYTRRKLELVLTFDHNPPAVKKNLYFPSFHCR